MLCLRNYVRKQQNIHTQCETVLRPLYLAGQIRNFAAQQGLGTLQHLEVVRRRAELLLVGAAGPYQRRRQHAHDHHDGCNKLKASTAAGGGERTKEDGWVSLVWPVPKEIRTDGVYRTIQNRPGRAGRRTCWTPTYDARSYPQGMLYSIDGE